MTMQTARIVQAVVLMMIVAMAASCAASKEYTAKLFAPRTQELKDSQPVALRFLEIDSAGQDQEGWVTTDIIMGRDTVNNTLALDNLAKTIPVNPVKMDTAAKKETNKNAPVVAETKATIPVETAPVAKAANPGEVRNKRSREK